MPINQFNDYEPPVSGGTIPIKLPGSYPGNVPQPRGYNPSPLPPPTDYYATRKEVRDLLAKYPIETLMKLVENATDGNLVTLGADGQVIDSKVNLSVLTAIVGDDSGKSARAIAAEEVATIVDGAPEALDTLKEAADIIEELIKQEQELQAELEKKANKDDVSKDITTINDSLTKKADTDKVWLRGDKVTGDTNYAQSIKVNEITSLDEIEGMAGSDGIKFGAPIVSNTVNYGGIPEPAFAVIEGNMIQAFRFEEESSNVLNSDLVLRGRSFQFQGNSYDDPDAAPPELHTEGDILCDGAIVTYEIIDTYGITQNLTIENNEISAHFTEEEGGYINWGTIVLNGSVELPYGGIYCPSHPITASSLDAYAYNVQEGGFIYVSGYGEDGIQDSRSIGYPEFSSLLSNSDYVQENLRGHITHDIVYDEMYGEVGAVIITPTDEYGGYSDFYFKTNGSLSMTGSLRAMDVSCDGYVSCYDIQASMGVYANSIDDGYGGMGGVSVNDFNDGMITSKLLAGKLHLEKYFTDGYDGYYDYVDIDVKNGLNLSLSYQGETLTFSFSDFATLREMIDNFGASQGA